MKEEEPKSLKTLEDIDKMITAYDARLRVAEVLVRTVAGRDKWPFWLYKKSLLVFKPVIDEKDECLTMEICEIGNPAVARGVQAYLRDSEFQHDNSQVWTYEGFSGGLSDIDEQRIKRIMNKMDGRVLEASSVSDLSREDIERFLPHKPQPAQGCVFEKFIRYPGEEWEPMKFID